MRIILTLFIVLLASMLVLHIDKDEFDVIYNALTNILTALILALKPIYDFLAPIIKIMGVAAHNAGLTLWIIALGFVLIFYSSVLAFSETDGRTETGYKDNAIPKAGKGLFFFIIGSILIWTGSVGLSE